MFKSEAQAYQAWRRDLKKERNKAQRRQNIYMYQHINKCLHRSLLKHQFGRCKDPERVAFHWQCKVSECQTLLNKYEVKNVY